MRIVISALLIVFSWINTASAGPLTIDTDEWLLRRNAIGVDAKSLLQYLHDRSPDYVDSKVVGALIQQLGHREFAKREEATRELKRIGVYALSAIRVAAESPDLELARRAKECIQETSKIENCTMPFVVVRRLVRLRPEGALEALLHYLPVVIDPATEEEMCYGIDELIKTQKAMPVVLLDALQDRSAPRRAIAACLVALRGSPEQRAAVRKLLSDVAPFVRLRAAQGLLARKDKSSIPILISLLENTRIAVAWQAEELLHWVAGDDAPECYVGSGQAEIRKQCRSGWESWYGKHGAGLDMNLLDNVQRVPRLLILSQSESGKQDGRISLWGCSGKPRWQLKATGQAQFVEPDRILVSDNVFEKPDRTKLSKQEFANVIMSRNCGKIYECDLHGKTIWNDESKEPVNNVCRLSNGHLLLLSGIKLREVTLDTTVPDAGQFRDADQISFHCLETTADGLVVCARNIGHDGRTLARCDVSSGQIVAMTSVHDVVSNLDWRRARGHSNGHYLLLERFTCGGLLEIDAAGLSVWRYSAGFPVDTRRLRNGNTLVSCGSFGRGRVIEVDADGRLLCEMFPGGETPLLSQCLNLISFGFNDPQNITDLSTSVLHFRKGLLSRDWNVRFKSALALEHLGPQAVDAVPDLINSLDDPVELVRHVTADAIANVGMAAFPHVERALTDHRAQIRACALGLLSDLCQERQGFAERLRYALGRENAVMRLTAADQLAQLGPAARIAIPELITLLKDRDRGTICSRTSVAQSAAITLGNIGPGAKEAVPALIQALAASDLRLRLEVLKA